MNEKRRVFVAMPFKEELTDLYRYGIKRACEALGVECERVDEQIFSQDILERIYSQIDEADLVIGEMSIHNPNVYYEIGYARGRRKKLLLVARSAADIPFDLRGYRHIIHDGSITKLEAELGPNIRALLDSTSDLGPRAIGGRWVGTVWDEHPNPLFPEISLEMDFRWAGRVEGFGVLHAGDVQLHLKFTGDFEHDRYLLLSYKPVEKSAMQFGASLLRLDGTGNALEGRYLGYGAINDTIVYGRVELIRQPR